MKIVNISCWVIEAEHPKYAYRWRNGLQGSGDGTNLKKNPVKAIIRIDTDENIYGSIETHNALSALSLVERRFKNFIGANPLMSENLWHEMWELDRIEEIPLYQQRFDMALQNLKRLGEGYGARDEYRFDIARN